MSLRMSNETLWVKIKNLKSQNVLCCCAYRHPNTDVKKFNEYVDQTMHKISKENKLIFLMGDFIINLSNLTLIMKQMTF